MFIFFLSSVARVHFHNASCFRLFVFVVLLLIFLNCGRYCSLLRHFSLSLALFLSLSLCHSLSISRSSVFCFQSSFFFSFPNDVLWLYAHTIRGLFSYVSGILFILFPLSVCVCVCMCSLFVFICFYKLIVGGVFRLTLLVL